LNQSQTNDPQDNALKDKPFSLFHQWFAEAKASEPSLPEAMSLATVDESGLPNTRLVLLKGYGPSGFVFYTNAESQKGIELAQNPKAALCFHWKSLKRQVRLRGMVEVVSEEEADVYFASRAKDSQIGAWASKQSRVLAGRFELEAEVAKFAAKYALKSVDRPPFWKGYRLLPIEMEFWQERSFRLHDRWLFRRTTPSETDWTEERLYP